jgi:hypothetical protein
MNQNSPEQKPDHRGWPPDMEMSPEIKALVDRRWAEYGLG